MPPIPAVVIVAVILGWGAYNAGSAAVHGDKKLGRAIEHVAVKVVKHQGKPKKPAN